MKMRTGPRLALLATTALAALPLAERAQAQSANDSTLQRMNSIESQIKSLQDQLRDMRRDLASRDSQLRAAQRDASRAREEAQRAQTAASRPAAAPSYAQGQTATGQTAIGQTSTGQLQGGVPNLSGPAQITAGQQNASTTPETLPMGTFRIGGVTVQLGGFIEAAGIFRTRNEVADIGSNFNTGIPFPQSALYHENEFRGSARQSRLSLLIQGDVDQNQRLAAYFETDFQGSAPTANSVESNSYNLRLRQAYGTYDNSAWGFHFLGGQAWSLLTPQKFGITPRQEDIPLTIDAQYVAGFNWTRQPELRFVGDFLDHKLWAGLSLESPQAVFFTGPNGTGSLNGTVNSSNPGGSGFSSGTNYSDDIAPDIIGKVAWDPGYGHYEAYGLLRFLHDRVSVVGDGNNHTVAAGGGGVATVIPIIKGALEFHGNALAGYGIGRYGSAQLPDATFSQTGAPVPLPEVIAMGGLVSHPIQPVDLYAYVGTEQVRGRSFSENGKGYGYGSPLYVNTGCYVELSTASCQANTSSIVEGTLGGWWRFLHGSYGTAQVGAQYEYLRRNVFDGVGGSKGTDDNVVLVSFRYMPFQ